MPIQDYTKFKGIKFVGRSSLETQIEQNLNFFLNWGFLGIGSFFNVDDFPESGVYGGTFNDLRLVNDPNYTDGQVWESPRSNWVWETGVHHSTQPIEVSGAYVNNVFRTISETGQFNHYVNHPLGRIVFDTAIDTSSNVKVRYSYKWVNVIDSDNPWFKELQFGSLRPDDTHFNQKGSGAWDQLANNRLQLPAVVIEAGGRRTFQGYQLGGGQWVRTDIFFHVFAEHKWERNQIVDTLSLQSDKTIFFFDVNAVENATGWPLDVNGSLETNANMYPDFVGHPNDGGFRWGRARFNDTSVQSAGQINTHLFGGVVKTTIEVIDGSI